MSKNIEDFVLNLLASKGGRYARYWISNELWEKGLLGFGQDVNDAIDPMIRLGLIVMDADEIVEMIPDEKQLAAEKEILYESLLKSPTDSMSIGSAEKLLVEAKSPINLREVIYRQALREKLGIGWYPLGDIIYIHKKIAGFANNYYPPHHNGC